MEAGREELWVGDTREDGTGRAVGIRVRARSIDESAKLLRHVHTHVCGEDCSEESYLYDDEPRTSEPSTRVSSQRKKF